MSANERCSTRRQHRERHACQKFQSQKPHRASDVWLCWAASQLSRGRPRCWQPDHRLHMVAAVRWRNSMQLSGSTMRQVNCFASKVIANRPAPCFSRSETFVSSQMPTSCFMRHFRPTSGTMRPIRKGTRIWRAITTLVFARLSSPIIIWIRLPSIPYPAGTSFVNSVIRNVLESERSYPHSPPGRA
jgi:hypothetical protein